MPSTSSISYRPRVAPAGWRYLRCTDQAQDGILPTLTTRLKLIEEVSGSTTDLAVWHEQAREVLGLTPDAVSGLNDDGLLLFFHKECTQHLEGQRLSDGVGKGL